MVSHLGDHSIGIVHYSLGRPFVPRTILPDLLGISGDIILLLIMVVVILTMAFLVIKFLNQSIELANQIEKEMGHSENLEILNDDLEEEISRLKDKLQALEIYARELAVKEEKHKSASSHKIYHTEGSYGDVEVVQHYEDLSSDLVYTQDVEVDKGAALETAYPAKETVGPKKKAQVVPVAKAISIPTLSDWSKEGNFVIQDVFMIYKDGRLITHLSKKIRIIDDSEIIGSMIAAVQMAVRESFKRESKGTLDALRFSDLTVLLETGTHLNLAVVIRGRNYQKLKGVMKDVVKAVHKAWGSDIEAWNGARTNVGFLEKIIQRDLLDRFETETFHKATSKTMDLSQAKVFNPE